MILVGMYSKGLLTTTQYDFRRTAGFAKNYGDLFKHDTVRFRLQPVKQDYRAPTVTLCNSAVRTADGRPSRATSSTGH